MATTLSVKDAATKIGTDPRTLRKFLRSESSPIESVGKGHRYTIEAKGMRSLTSKFTKWASEVNSPKETEVTEGEDEVTDEVAETE